MATDDTVVHIERVCCLECGVNYVKPSNGSAAQSDAGCPKCGYLGWISAIVPTEDADRAASRLRDRAASSRIRARAPR
jgi:hypothetical protein